MQSHPDGSPPRPVSVFLLCVLLVCVYLSNLRFVGPGDTIATRMLPFSLLVGGHLYVEDWVQAYLEGQLPHGAYFLAESRGHLMSSYPILTPLVVSPLYVAPAWWIARQPAPVPAGTVMLLAETMEKLVAALLAALSAGVLYVALRKVASPVASLILTLVYALASNTWSISSQALWTHAVTQVSFAFLLWVLLRGPEARGYAFWAGLALAMAAANKPPNVLVVLPFLVFFARGGRRRFLLFCAPLVVLGSLLLVYNLYFFGNISGAYLQAFRTIGYGSIAQGFRGTPVDGILGLLASPSRGLFIYMPWTIVALWGATRLCRENLGGWGRHLFVGVAALFLLYALLERWWGGWSFGPRYLTDLLPFFAFFLVPVWPCIRTRAWLRAAFGLAVALALWVQVVGAYYYPNGEWDNLPRSVDEYPERVWDLSDTQVGRAWRAGPTQPNLYYRWRDFLSAAEQ